MRRLVLVLFAVLFAVGAAGARAESATKSTPKPASTPYWQVVDDTTKDRFKADGSWGTSFYRLDESSDGHRFAYRFARPDKRGPPRSSRSTYRRPRTTPSTLAGPRSRVSAIRYL